MTRVLNAGTSLTGRRQIRGGGLAFLLGYFCHLERGKTHRVPGAKVMSKAAAIWCSHLSQQYSGRTSDWQGPSLLFSLPQTLASDLLPGARVPSGPASAAFSGEMGLHRCWEVSTHKYTNLSPQITSLQRG